MGEWVWEGVGGCEREMLEGVCVGEWVWEGMRGKCGRVCVG